MGERNKIILSGIVGLIIGLLIGQATWSKDLTPNWANDKERLIGLNPKSELSNKSGAEFDQEILEAMILNHEGAIEIARLILNRSEHQELTDLAEQILAEQSSDLNKMRQWLTSWFSANR